ncbi:MAG: hypothetical protein V4733_09865 [Verrucomicrobiota bacterium]
MNHYRQSIVFFGLLLPLLTAAAIVGGAAYARADGKASLKQKIAAYTAYTKSRTEALQAESEVNRLQPHLERWRTSLAQDTSSNMNSNLREIYAALPGKEIQQTAFDKPPGHVGFGSVSLQKSSQIRIALRGTYRTLQLAFLDLETRMPQLLLEELHMEPVKDSTSQVNFQISYTAWEL